MQEIRDAFAGFTVRTRVPLSECGSFRIGGPVHTLLDCADPVQLGHIRTKLREHALPVVLIGGGTNLLFADSGWPGVMVRYTAPFTPPDPEPDGTWRVNAAMPLDTFAAWACEQGWSGWEAFSGIPGTLGGAVVGNAGAWGTQIGDLIDAVHVVDRNGEPSKLSRPECDFVYRSSRLKESGLWVSELHLPRPVQSDPAHLQAERRRILALRAEKHPDWRQTPCIGSFFKNVEASSAAERRRAAGWFLEEVGAKDLRVGGAGVFPKHANILIKQDSTCTARDVQTLATELQRRVLARFGIHLQAEIRYLDPANGFKNPFLSFNSSNEKKKDF